MSGKTSFTRRKVIKALGTGCAVSSLGTSSRATSTGETQDFRNLIDQAHNAREEAAKEAAKEAQEIRDGEGPNAEQRAREHRISEENKAWEDFLTEHELAYQTHNQTYEFTKERGDNSELNTHAISDVDTTGIHATISLITHDYTHYYVSTNFKLYFSYRTTGHACYRQEYGEDPLDGAGLRWNSEAWNYDGDTFSERSSTSSNVEYSDDFNSQEAFAFDVDDAAIFSDWADDADCKSH